MLDRSTNLFTTDTPPSGAAAAAIAGPRGDVGERADHPNAFVSEIAPVLDAPVDDAPAPTDAPAPPNASGPVATSAPPEPEPSRAPRPAGSRRAPRLLRSWIDALWRNRRKVLVAGLGLLVGIVLSAALTSAMRLGGRQPSSHARPSVVAPAQAPTARAPRGKRAAARRSAPAARKAKRKRDQTPPRTGGRAQRAAGPTHVSPPRAAVPSVDPQPVATPSPSAPAAPTAPGGAAEFSIER